MYRSQYISRAEALCSLFLHTYDQEQVDQLNTVTLNTCAIFKYEWFNQLGQRWVWISPYRIWETFSFICGLPDLVFLSPLLRVYLSLPYFYTASPLLHSWLHGLLSQPVSLGLLPYSCLLDSSYPPNSPIRRPWMPDYYWHTEWVTPNKIQICPQPWATLIMPGKKGLDDWTTKEWDQMGRSQTTDTKS